MSRTIKIVFILSLLLNLTIVYVAFKALEYRGHINYFLDKYTQVVNEFSGRSYFHQENMELLHKPNKGMRIVLFGTQVTANWNIDSIQTEYEIINRGLPHQRLAGYLLRFRPDVIDLQPKAVVIEVSSYNFRSQHTVKEIKDYVLSMAELAIYNNIKPVLTTVIPLREESPDSLLFPDELRNYSIMDSLFIFNNWLRGYATTNGIDIIDFNQILSNEMGYMKSEYSSSAIDLNESGYELIKDAFIKIDFNN